MQNTVYELRHKLLRALDDDYNVVEMSTVLEVVSILERQPITREILEQTRIGKFVNEMRRKTNNKDLAKRAKNLVRRWKQVVDQTPTTASSTSSLNGDSVAGVGRGGPTPPQQLLTRATNRLQGSGSKSTSPASRPTTPSSMGSSRPVTPSLPKVLVSPKVPPSRPLTPQTPHYKPVSPALANLKKGVSPVLPRTSQTPPLPANYRDFSRADALKRKRRSNQSTSPEEPLSKRIGMDMELNETRGNGGGMHKEVSPKIPNGLLTGSACDISQQSQGLSSKSVSQSVLQGTSKSSDLKLVIPIKRNHSVLDTPESQGKERHALRTPKVKTTAELIAGLTASGGLRLSKSNETVNMIANDRIYKERDTYNQSVVPAEAKPRPRRKPGLPPNHSDDRTMQLTKTELVRKFLQTSLTPSNSGMDLSSPHKNESPGGSRSDSPSQALHNNNNQIDSCSFDAEAQPVMFFIGDEDLKQEKDLIHCSQAGFDNAEQARLAALAKDPWSCIPPLDIDSLDWSTYEYLPVAHAEVTEELTQRLHADQLPDVNGQTDDFGEWRSWSQTSTRPTYNGDLLHILPYVTLIEDD